MGRATTPEGGADWGERLAREELEQRAGRGGTGSYGHNSPAKAPGAPLPDLFGRMNLPGGKLDPSTGLATENLLSAAAQLSNLSNNYEGGPSVAGVGVSLAPGIPMTDQPTSYTGGFPGPAGRFGGPQFSTGGPRFTAPGLQASTAPIFTAPPLSAAARATGLNPNAPDFNRGGLYNQGGIRGGPPRGPQLPPAQQKVGNNFGAFNNFGAPSNNFNSGFSGSGAPAAGGGSGNFQNILTNQGINAYLSSLGSNMTAGGPPGAPGQDLAPLAGLADLNLGGRTLSELTDMLAPEAAGPSPGFPGAAPPEIEPKFSRPIGAERRTGPSPGLGSQLGSIGPQARKVDPFGVWEMPPSHYNTDNMGGPAPALGPDTNSFNLLPPSLSGQTLQSALDNLSRDMQYNGVGMGGHGVLDPASLGGQTPGSSGFGLSPAITPSKVDYSDWGTGSTSGSAPGSGTKVGDQYRGDPAQARRNMVGHLAISTIILTNLSHHTTQPFQYKTEKSLNVCCVSEPDVAEGVG